MDYPSHKEPFPLPALNLAVVFHGRPFFLGVVKCKPLSRSFSGVIPHPLSLLICSLHRKRFISVIYLMLDRGQAEWLLLEPQLTSTACSHHWALSVLHITPSCRAPTRFFNHMDPSAEPCKTHKLSSVTVILFWIKSQHLQQ